MTSAALQWHAVIETLESNSCMLPQGCGQLGRHGREVCQGPGQDLCQGRLLR